MNNVITTIKNVTTTIKPVAPVVAGLILVIIGIMYMCFKDEQKKASCTSWMLNVLIGFAIVYLAISIVNWFSGQVVGY
ncbi:MULTISPECIES: pilin [Bacillus subtilis group]|uniref:pilin n=1 Tax=Bacillus subtilis group TaxID=653685 RepID=UPI0005E8B034|nr:MULTISPECIES: pilin [Bacillus subtilis group]KJH56488.1 hypothetical protein UF14_14615 [Bacillus licheniformis]MEC2098601.1 pilin [Bacillus paralicheniformis]MEC2114642.1 pilin [Bacillus paralicheniformis]MEC2318463.1 pilin [Bacillus paralicheniformis]